MSAAPGPAEAGQQLIWLHSAHGQDTSWGPGTSTLNRPQEEATEDGVGPMETLEPELCVQSPYITAQNILSVAIWHQKVSSLLGDVW